MYSKTEQICRLCLKEPKINGFQSIDDTMKQLFDILLLKLDLDMSSDLIICQDCLNVGKKCLNFKSTCINREEIMLSFSVGRRKFKQNIKFIYVEKEQVVMSDDENLDICRLCMSRLERNNFVPVPLNTLLNETAFEVVTKYMPETDFNIPKDPIICTTCKENLQDYLQFVLNYLDTEMKIKAYCREDETVLRFSFKDIVEYAVDYQIHKTKQAINRTEETEGIYPESYTGIIKQEEFDTKYEEINFNENSHKSPSDTILNNYNSSFSTKIYGSDMISLKIKGHNIHGYAYQQPVQGNITEDCSIHGNGLEVKRNECSDIQINRAETEQRECSETNSMATNGAPDMDIYDYAEAASESKLERHMLGHEDLTEIKMCKCALCAYEDKIKMYLEGYKEVSEIKMYKCTLCAYETKRKSHLEGHMLVHKDVLEVKMFKCSLCAYETKRKSSLKRHMLVHKDVPGKKMFKCALCAHEAKTKTHLKMHTLVHKDVSEIKMFKCSFCAFESKYSSSGIKHMLIHKDISEIKMYKCKLCIYESKTKGNFKRHMLVHKDVSKVQMFKCSMCTFKSKHKDYIKKHMLVHKDVSDIKMYKCALCAYKTKRRNYLQKHILVHKDVSEIKMYKCSFCDFEAKQERYIKNHMLSHKNVSDK